MIQESSTFLINPTKSTPFVEFNYQDGKLDIIGKRAPEGSPEFYRQMNARIQEYLSARDQSLDVNISFEDCDTGSNEDFFNLLKSLKPAVTSQRGVSVNLYFYGSEVGEPKTLETQMNALGIPYRMRSYNV